MATNRSQVYKCEKCGMIVEVIDGAGGKLVCCGQAMTLLEENTQDAAKEKHVPVIEKTGDGIKVKVGSVAHPMEESHFIDWIELVDGKKLYRKFLAPGNPPEAVFNVTSEDATARSYCNLHGLWRS